MGFRHSKILLHSVRAFSRVDINDRTGNTLKTLNRHTYQCTSTHAQADIFIHLHTYTHTHDHIHIHMQTCTHKQQMCSNSFHYVFITLYTRPRIKRIFPIHNGVTSLRPSHSKNLTILAPRIETGGYLNGMSIQPDFVRIGL